MGLRHDTACVALFALVACGTDNSIKQPAAPMDPEELAEQLDHAPPDSLDAQVARGARIFDGTCDFCHGSRGQGRSGVVEVPQIIGPGVLASSEVGQRGFENAQSLYDFVSTRMPRNRPGDLAPDEYWDVVAYLLYSSGIELEAPLSPANANEVRLGAPVAMTR